MRILLTLLFAGILASCASRVPISGGGKLDQSYSYAGGAFDEGGDIIIAAVARPNLGRLEICGARIQSFIATSVPNSDSEVAAGARVVWNGKTVMRNLSKFNVVPMFSNVNGQPTTCFLTGHAWTGEPGTLEVVVPGYQRRASREQVTKFVPGPVAQVIGENPLSEEALAAERERLKQRTNYSK